MCTGAGGSAPGLGVVLGFELGLGLGLGLGLVRAVAACLAIPPPQPKPDPYPHPNEVRAIASFLGLDATDTALIARVVEGSSFASMREAAVAAEALTEGARAAEGAGAEGTAAARSPSYEVPGKAKQLERRLADHLRKGEVGDWRTHFEPYPELLEAFEAAFAREMRGCAGRRWDCGGGKVMTVCTDTR